MTHTRTIERLLAATVALLLMWLAVTGSSGIVAGATAAVSEPAMMQVAQRVTAGDANPGDRFGQSVAISGDLAVVGAPYAGESGAAYVYVRSGTSWAQEEKLTPTDAAAGQRFGCSVAILADTIVVGAYGDDTGGLEDAGAAYVFTRSGADWTQQEKLLADDRQEGDLFGMSVDVFGDTAVIGAPYEDNSWGTDAGSAYAFTRSGGDWSQQEKLYAAEGAATDHFGESVAVYQDTTAVGASEHASGAGIAFVFLRSGTTWLPQQTVASMDGAVGDGFGSSVALWGNTLVVGAFMDDNAGGSDAGAAYVYTRTGATWYAQQKLVAAEGRPGAYFGRSVGVSGDYAVVGADMDGGDPTSSGVGYAFARSGTLWTQGARLLAPDPALGDAFGFSVDVSGNSGIFGAYGDDTEGGTNAGSAQVFATLAPVYRFYRPGSGSHFYTPSEAEKAHVIATWPTIYRYEGVAYRLNPLRNDYPLYRFYNKRNGSHFYTASVTERDSVIANLSAIYSYDGPTYKVSTAAAPGKPPVYRFYNKRNGGHFYTASEAEKASVIANLAGIYAYEGIAYWLGQ